MAATYAPQEKQYYDQLFAVVDKDNTGILPGQDAYPFLTSSNLPTGTLGEVWAIADPDNNGFLTKDGWYRAARLIGWLQKGGAKNVEENLVTRAGPYPTFDKGPPPPAQPAIQPQLTGQQIQPLSAHNTGSVAGLPPLTSADRAKFTRLFAGAGPSNGLVSGDKARDMFLKSNLGYDKLGQIWNLADTQERGSLDLTDFIIGMYLIQSCMANPALNLPATLPPGTYELASGGRVPPPKAPASPISKQHTGNAGVPSPVRPQYTGGVGSGILQPQRTGQSATGVSTPPRPGAAQKSFASPPTTSSFSTLPSTSSFGGPTRQMSGFAPPQQNQHWDVTPQAKATSDQFFSQLDPQNKGVIEGDVAVPFMLQSQLDENSLASIWDLADIRKEGKLTRDEFAVAMHLINAKLAGQDIPASLPNSLVPPSLRDAYGSGSQEVLNQQGPSSATKDLFDVFGDDEPATAPTPKATTPQPPQPSQAPAFPTTFLSQPPPPPARRMTAQSTGQKTLSPAPTGQQATSGFGMAPFAPAARGSDLLGDDAAEDKPSTVPDQSAEIGNKQNQLNNINRNLPDLEKTHQELETTATSSAAQLEELEAKLSSARARHEAETKAVADLRIRVGEQKERLRKLESEVISAESDLSAMRSEKDELEQGLLSDKEEIRGLQKMMKEVEEEKTGMKLVLEKLKKEARQQKGMLSIAKKQLSTAEGSRDTVQQDIRQTEREIEKDKAEIERASSSPPVPTPAHTSPQSQPRDMFSPSIAATVPLPATPQALSPAPTGTSTRSNNPFERLTGPRPAPPPPQPSQSQSRAVPTPPAREEEPTSPSFGVAALAGAGAAVTAAAGVVVAGAETLYDAAKEAVTSSPEAKSDTREDEVDPFGAPAPSATEDDKTPVPPAAGEEADPFGIPNATGAAQSTDPFGAPSTSTPTAASGFDDEDFDSGFGDSFNAASAAQSTQPTADLHLAPASEPEPSTGAPTDFDSAFADFDRPGPDVQDLAEGIPEGLPKSEIPAGLAARPEAERTLSTQAAAPESAPATPGIETPSKLYQGDFTRSAPPPSGLASEVYPQADEGESSDEEEGPEDLEGPKRGYGSKIEIGQDSTPFDEAGTQDVPIAKSIVEPEEQPKETPAPVAPTSTGGSGVALAPPIPVGEEAIHKVRRSAPPPPSKATPSPAPVPAPVSQAGADEFDPFGAPAAPSSTTATTAVPDGSAPKTAAFDEDDFDFSDLPPAQVEQGQSQAQQGSSPAQGTTGGFDDEFAGFDDEFEKPDFGGNGGSDNSNSGSGSVSKGYEIVSPPTQRFDEWGFGGPGGHNQSQNQIQTHTQGHDAFSGQAGGVAPPASGSGFSFDDAFGGDFEPQPEAAGSSNQASSATQAYAPPPGPPPRQGQESQQQGNLQPPPMPERRPSGAQEDDIDQVKNLCAMGFSRGLVVEALAANGYDVQKALNVLLSA